MTLDVHRITSGQLRAIADGTSSPSELAILAASQRSKTLAMLAMVVRTAVELGHPDAALAASGWELLARVQQESPAAFEETVRHPSVGAWGAEAAPTFGGRSASRASPGRMALVAAAAAIRGGVACSLELPAAQTADSVMHLPSLGTVALPRVLPGQTVILRHDGDRAEISAKRGTIGLPRHLGTRTPDWRPLTVSAAQSRGMRLRLIIDDADPFRLPRSGVPLSQVTGHQQRHWKERIAAGWRILADHHPRVAVDVQALISTLTPLSGADGAIRSVTSRRVFGSIGLSLPADDVSMALTLAHEVQHAKLYAVMDLLPLFTEHSPALYYAPWRPDPRPLANLLQGMYAHLGIAHFWRLHREVPQAAAGAHHAHVEFVRWRNACAQVAQIISGRPELTRYGAAFVEGMLRVLHEWRDESVPPAAQAEATRLADEHQRHWEKRLDNTRATTETETAEQETSDTA